METWLELRNFESVLVLFYLYFFINLHLHLISRLHVTLKRHTSRYSCSELFMLHHFRRNCRACTTLRYAQHTSTNQGAPFAKRANQSPVRVSTYTNSSLLQQINDESLCSSISCTTECWALFIVWNMPKGYHSDSEHRLEKNKKTKKRKKKIHGE